MANGWDPKWLLKNAPAGTYIPGAGIATGPGGAPQKGLPSSTVQYSDTHSLPAPGTAPGVTPQPYDPSLDIARGQATRIIAISRGESAYQLGNLGFDYGYNPDGTVNTANPYSRAALYQLSHDNTARGTRNGMASNGQLFSGAYNQAQSLNDQALARNQAQNKLGFDRAVHGVQSGQLTTAANNSLGVSDTDFNSLLKATYPGSS